ncbi:DNA-dependent RNA polymerase auxiliary subunit epsilon family protein [Gracilibacillus oryzae]|uniref:DNA-directed RNA polymerase subunit epsilon n=1 Tax=Gracilibacillus oryzae TaxID=1672701 RepID=A0A7C8GV19_9BACI|nr:RNA polymerase epsilon subunit [Gracilibacillus oryzae]KAB8138600.1 DNA-dependent RNA polymerase auxiliary subunit epsilon family protein [Gracilibacillus oryzae]
MVYKVLYQEDALEIPVREHTKSLYVRAQTEREVRQFLKERNVNIEFIQLLNDQHLAYEQQSEFFRVEND